METNKLKEILSSKKTFHNNRGMNLENDINISNIPLENIITEIYEDTK